MVSLVWNSWAFLIGQFNSIRIKPNKNYPYLQELSPPKRHHTSHHCFSPVFRSMTLLGPLLVHFENDVPPFRWSSPARPFHPRIPFCSNIKVILFYSPLIIRPSNCSSLSVKTLDDARQIHYAVQQLLERYLLCRLFYKRCHASLNRSNGPQRKKKRPEYFQNCRILFLPEFTTKNRYCPTFCPRYLDRNKYAHARTLQQNQ